MHKSHRKCLTHDGCDVSPLVLSLLLINASNDWLIHVLNQSIKYDFVALKRTDVR